MNYLRNEKNAIGILGGAFDPIHFGHLRAALEVQEKFTLDKVYFVPTAKPVHKSSTTANIEQRLIMLELALSNEPRYVIDLREIHRDTPSYMVDTLVDFRKEFGNQIPIALILGLDAFIQLDTWHLWEKLFDLTHIVIVSRPGKVMQVSEGLEKLLSARTSTSLETFFKQPQGSIFFHEMIQLNISSTQIRHMIANHYSARYLIPDNVWAYIQESQIYE